jgi:ADP-heptose:LPS heptosyltransferase
VPEPAVREARRLFGQWGLDDTHPTLFIQPFSNGHHKNWPFASYLDIARSWKSRGLQVVFGGGPADRPAMEPARQAGFPVAAGTPLLVSAGLVSLSSVVLGGDTGLLHLAVAMGKRVVMIIGSTQPGSCFPFQHSDWTVLPSAGTELSAVNPEAVLGACTRALAEQENVSRASARDACSVRAP